MTSDSDGEGTTSETIIRRGFVSIAEGQVHYRHAPGPARAARPLVMLHASPGSSLMLAPLIAAFGASRPAYALDTLGNGDSARPALADPPLDYFADAHLRAIDALGLDAFDLYGSHTGGNIACEIAIRAPERVRSMILDGMSLYHDAERDEMLAQYAPAIVPDLNGSQINWVWHFVRDTYMFWPWYRRDPAHARTVGLPSADALHEKVVEVLKAVRTYHLSYRAAIAYPKRERLPLVTVRTLLACAKTDMLARYMDDVARLLPRAQRLETPGFGTSADAARTIALFGEFLGREREIDHAASTTQYQRGA
jgi:pimeloyl-ACP methyl ester carboxylesterase